jgi:hypothetical protein
MVFVLEIQSRRLVALIDSNKWIRQYSTRELQGRIICRYKMVQNNPSYMLSYTE